MRSESFEGCILDHGFQVLLPAYPSYKKLRLGLQLQSFGRGAWCFSPGKRERFVDPLHHPIDFLRHLNQSPVGLSDMVSFAKLALTKPTNQSTHDYLDINGFSLKSRERFFRPFLRGILLDPDLRSPIEMSAFFMRMFLFGGTALPENGIQAFARALATDLDISLDTEVFSIQGNDVETKNGDQFHAKVIVNTSPDLSPSNVQWLSTTCHYFLSRKSVPMQSFEVYRQVSPTYPSRKWMEQPSVQATPHHTVLSMPRYSRPKRPPNLPLRWLAVNFQSRQATINCEHLAGHPRTLGRNQPSGQRCNVFRLP